MTLAMVQEMWWVADVRYAADVKVLHAPNERHVYLFGNEFGECGYILAEHDGDAWEELEEHIVDVDGPCDHGGDITDEQRFAWLENGSIAGQGCDCSLTESGRWCNEGYWWLRELRLTVDHFYMAFGEEA